MSFITYRAFIFWWRLASFQHKIKINNSISKQLIHDWLITLQYKYLHTSAKRFVTAINRNNKCLIIIYFKTALLLHLCGCSLIWNNDFYIRIENSYIVSIIAQMTVLHSYVNPSDQSWHFEFPPSLGTRSITPHLVNYICIYKIQSFAIYR